MRARSGDSHRVIGPPIAHVGIERLHGGGAESEQEQNVTKFTPSKQDAVSMIAVALSIVAISVAPALASEPTESGAQARHCVQSVSEGGKEATGKQPVAPPQCFASFSEAISFATGGSVVIPDNLDLEQQLHVLGDSLASVAQEKVVDTVVIAVDFNYKNYNAGTLTWTSGSNCSAGSYKYANSMPKHWDNKVSSTKGYGNCGDNIVFENTNRSGASRTCTANCSDLGALANEVSSREWRY